MQEQHKEYNSFHMRIAGAYLAQKTYPRSIVFSDRGCISAPTSTCEILNIYDSSSSHVKAWEGGGMSERRWTYLGIVSIFEPLNAILVCPAS